MATSVDISLDDIIMKNSERSGGGPGKARRGKGSVGNFVGGRMTDLEFEPARRMRNFPLQHHLLEDSIRSAGITGVEVGTKLYVSNLDHGVSNDDIRDLFSEIGDLKRYTVHYDKSGRSTGSAEVVYIRRSDAFAALEKYNSVLLDGKPMKIEIVGASAEASPIAARVNVTGVNRRRNRTVVMTAGPGRTKGSFPSSRGTGPKSSRGGLRSGQGCGRGRGRGRGRGFGGGRGKKPVEKTAEQLDKELESYHAMQS